MMGRVNWAHRIEHVPVVYSGDEGIPGLPRDTGKSKPHRCMGCTIQHLDEQEHWTHQQERDAAEEVDERRRVGALSTIGVHQQQHAVHWLDLATQQNNGALLASNWLQALGHALTARRSPRSGPRGPPALSTSIAAPARYPPAALRPEAGPAS